jgi:hypothetical protein
MFFMPSQRKENNMATSVYETTDIELMDGTKLKMRPLKISLLREFMKTFEGIGDVADSNDKSMDVLMDCVQIAMKQYNSELAESREQLEDVMDLPSVYRVIEAAAGIKLDDQGNVLTAGTLGTN